MPISPVTELNLDDLVLDEATTILQSSVPFGLDRRPMPQPPRLMVAPPVMAPQPLMVAPSGMRPPPAPPAPPASPTPGDTAVSASRRVQSLAPVEVPVDTTRTVRQRDYFLPILSIGLLGLGVFVGLMALVAGPRAAKLLNRPGALIVTVGGQGGARLDALQVSVDGTKRCTSSPCRVVGLEPGAHVVTVSAPGHEASAPNAISIHRGDEAVLNVSLQRSHAQDAVVTAANESPPAESHPAALDADALAVDLGGEPQRAAPIAAADALPRLSVGAARHPPSRRAAADPVLAKPGKKAELSLNAAGPSQLVVDGHPVGATPKSLKLAPGHHVLVFATPDGQRVVKTVDVAPGKGSSVSADPE